MGVVLSPDDRTVISASIDGSMRFWDARTGVEQFRQDYPMELTCLACAASRNLIAVGGRNGCVYLCDAKTGASRGILTEGQPPVAALSFSPNGDTLAAAVGDTLFGWNVAALEQKPAKP